MGTSSKAAQFDDGEWLESGYRDEPTFGWDNPRDLREAEQFLLIDASPVIPGKLGDKAIVNNSAALRRLGVSKSAAVKLMHKRWPDYPRDALRNKSHAAYDADTDIAGIDSQADFEEPDDESERFRINQHRQPIANDPFNLRLACRKLDVQFRFDAFAHKAMIDGLDGYGPVLQDDAVRHIRFACKDRFEFLPDKDLLFEFISNEARSNSFHPVREYFDKVQSGWDGKDRLDGFLVNYAGAADTEFNRAVGSLPFIAAVRRIRNPGAKYDEMLVLESSQGKNKSSALAIMAVHPEWFTDSFPLNADGRQTIEALQGKMLVEAAELQGMRKGDIEHIKALLSRSNDRGRPAYGRIQVEAPRQCVFIGTSNSRSYLRDDTGNRRFWPVEIKQFDLEKLKQDRDQLWAEAAVREALGEDIRLDRSLWTAAAKEQSSRTDIAADPFTDTFRTYLDDKAGRISVEDAWRILGLERAGQRTQDHNRRFGAALRFLGWQRKSLWLDGRTANGYTRGKGAKGKRRIIVSRSNDGTVFVDYEDSAPSEEET